MTTAQSEFVQLLKTKGTGPTMGKHLSSEQLRLVSQLFLDTTVHLTTKATLLTAILSLEKTAEEQAWLALVMGAPDNYLPTELIDLLPLGSEPAHPFLILIHRVISGNHLSESEAALAMDFVFDATIPDHFKAAFMEAERLKRETLEENQAFLTSLIQRSEHRSCDLPFLIDLSASYDGYNRNYFLLPFSAAVLASIGFPCVLHGIDEISPKNGMNTSKLLRIAGKNPAPSFDDVVSDLQNTKIGWGYVDESVFSPELYSLKALRFDMVKRPFLATLEKLVCPVRAKRTALVTSYTHPPYRQVLTHLIGHYGIWDQALILRGTEGGIQLNTDRRTPWVTINGDRVSEGYISPTDFGFGESAHPLLDEALDPVFVLNAGVAALSGASHRVYSIIEYQVLSIVHLLGLISDLNHAQLRIIKSIESGDALRRWTLGSAS